MGLRPEFTRQDPGLDKFLFAPVWQEESGSFLTTLSAFGRVGVDPWPEAARLAAMPRKQAVTELASFLTKLPQTDKDTSAVATLARQLVSLLPKPPGTAIRSQPDLAVVPTKYAKLGFLLALGVGLIALQISGWLF